MSINRPPFYAAFTGLAAPGSITTFTSGVAPQVGDYIAVIQTNGVVPPANSFEPVCSVAGQIQQTGTGLANAYTAIIIPQGWKSLQ